MSPERHSAQLQTRAWDVVDAFDRAGHLHVAVHVLDLLLGVLWVEQLPEPVSAPRTPVTQCRSASCPALGSCREDNTPAGVIGGPLECLLGG